MSFSHVLTEAGYKCDRSVSQQQQKNMSIDWSGETGENPRDVCVTCRVKRDAAQGSKQQVAAMRGAGNDEMYDLFKSDLDVPSLAN